MNKTKQNPQKESSPETSNQKPQNDSDSQQENKSPKGSKRSEMKTVVMKSKHQKSNPKGRPVVNYDSKTKTLIFKKQFLNEGEPSWTQGVTVSLENFDESTRQFIIALAKQAINFANAHQMVFVHLKRSNGAMHPEEKPKSDEEKTDDVNTSKETQKDKQSNKDTTPDKTE